MLKRTEGVRWVHLPTGLTGVSRDCGPRRGKWAFYEHHALAVMRSRVARHLGAIEPTAPIRRTYDLCPPLGIAPNIRQGARWLASCREDVLGILDGRIDGMLAASRRP